MDARSNKRRGRPIWRAPRSFTGFGPIETGRAPRRVLGRLLAIAGLKAGVTFENPANCIAAGQPMIDQYHFEAPEAQSRDDLERAQTRLTKPWARLEMRLQKEIE